MIKSTHFDVKYLSKHGVLLCKMQKWIDAIPTVDQELNLNWVKNQEVLLI